MGILDGFSAEQIAQLALELDQRKGGEGDRTAEYRPRQLHDLTRGPYQDPLTGKWVAAPTFFPSAPADPRAAFTRPPYRRLLWHKKSLREVTVKSEADYQSKMASDEWLDRPPVQVALTAEARAQQMFDALSPEDQALVLEQQRQTKIRQAQEALGALSDEQSAHITKTARKRRSA
jgi:hypothetical protein